MKDLASSVVEGIAGGFGEGMNEFKQYAVITAAFWAAQSFFQVAAGALKVHSGRSALLVSGYGALTTLASTKVALDTQNILFDRKFEGNVIERVLRKSQEFFGVRNSKDNVDIRPVIRTLLLSAVTYAVLEGKAFATAVPSSVISVGVFARGNLVVQLIEITYGRFIMQVLEAPSKLPDQSQRILSGAKSKNWGRYMAVTTATIDSGSANPTSLRTICRRPRKY
jgi:hypothetical protein